jgi:protein gp37
MGAQTNIQWCDHTYNPWRGCRKVAEECENCYITGTTPFRVAGQTHGSVRVRAGEDHRKEPLRWNKRPWICDHCGFASAIRDGLCGSCKQVGKHRAKVFSLSLGDWLDKENVEIEWFVELLWTIFSTPELTYLLVTKRPGNFPDRIYKAAASAGLTGQPQNFVLWLYEWAQGKAPANVWIGVSQGADQEAALEIPAVVHFLSCEPMLRPLDMTHAYRFDWIIFGGESGTNARPCNVDWIQEGLKYCRENEIAAFVKQLGAAPVYTAAGMEFKSEDGRDFVRQRMADPKCWIPYNSPHNLAPKITHKKGGDMAEWPEQLRVREFPKVK